LQDERKKIIDYNLLHQYPRVYDQPKDTIDVPKIVNPKYIDINFRKH